MYCRVQRDPQDSASVRVLAGIAALVIERHYNEQAGQNAEDRPPGIPSRPFWKPTSLIATIRLMSSTGIIISRLPRSGCRSRGEPRPSPGRHVVSITCVSNVDLSVRNHGKPVLRRQTDMSHAREVKGRHHDKPA